VLLGFGSERRWLRFAGQRLGHLFPYLPTASAYNRRLRRAGPLVALAIQDIAAHTPSWCDQLRLVDSTPVPCASSRETVKRSALAGHAGYASAALAAGIPAKIVSERLGHATVQITLDTYSHVLPGLDAQAAETVARLIVGDGPASTDVSKA
jgi:integrase